MRVIFIVAVFVVTQARAWGETIMIHLGPFSAEVPASWKSETIGEGQKVRAVAPDAKTIGSTTIPVMVMIEPKERLGSSLQDLRTFLEEALDNDAKEGKEIIRKNWEKFNGRIGMESLQAASKPIVRGKAPNEFLTMTVQSDFVVEGEPLALIIRSYWVYEKEQGYLLRIVIPLEFADRYAKEIDQIARAVKVNGAPVESQ